MPYAPGIQSVPFRADMSGWGNALMQFIGDKQKREEQVKADAKSHKTYIAMGEQLGLDAKELNNAGLEGATGMVKGFIAKQEIERGIQQFAAAKQKMQQEQYAFQKQKQDASAVAQFQRSATNMTTPMQIPPGTFGPLYRGETIGGPISSEDRFNLMQKSGVNPDDQYKLMRAYGEMGGGDGAPFYNRADVGNLLPVKGAEGYGIAVTGPRQSQVIYTGGPQGSSINVPGVGDVGVITQKPGQSQIVPGQQTQGQLREALAKAEADIAKLRTKMKADPEMEQYLGGALAEQESLANSYRAALGNNQSQNSRTQKAPAAGTVMDGYRFKGGDPNDKKNWEKVAPSGN